MTQKNISKEDFILWSKKENKPAEKLDTVYHYTSIVELINSGDLNKLNQNYEFRCVKELNKKWQEKISEAIELTK